MNVISELKKLGLPENEYVVFGSGIMSALGIRVVSDIDLLVTPNLFETLQKKGWRRTDVEIEGRMRKRVSLNEIEAFKDFWYNNVDVNVMEMIGKAEFIENVPFLPLQEVVKIKRAFNRQKDLKDISLIENYLKKQ